MLAFLTRRKDNPMADTQTLETAQPTTEQTDSNILMRFLTQGGATVIVTGSGRYHAKDCRWKCLGCDDQSNENFPSYDWNTRREANEHAAHCRSMPKPIA